MAKLERSWKLVYDAPYDADGSLKQFFLNPYPICRTTCKHSWILSKQLFPYILTFPMLKVQTKTWNPIYHFIFRIYVALLQENENEQMHTRKRKIRKERNAGLKFNFETKKCEEMQCYMYSIWRKPSDLNLRNAFLFRK